MMSFAYRVIIAASILLVDLLIFFFPVTAVFLVYIIIFNPPWFRQFLSDLNHPSNV